MIQTPDRVKRIDVDEISPYPTNAGVKALANLDGKECIVTIIATIGRKSVVMPEIPLNKQWGSWSVPTDKLIRYSSNTSEEQQL